ncbi:MAG: type I methionyl aminopeptidase [Actinomycetes bacterium]
MYARKTPAQIATMRRAGRVVAEMHEECTRAARPGVTTAEIDAVARAVLDRRGARSNFLGYHGFPAVICASPNEVVVHGIPGDRVLAEGDILSIDCGAIIDGWHADAAVTVPVGVIDDDSARLLAVTRESLDAAIRGMTVGSTLGAIGAAVSEVAEAAGMAIVREYTGHGIGTAMHEEPAVPNYPNGPGHRMKLKAGLVLAVEPMVNLGRPATRELDDGWTVVTVDGSRSAHFEHTIAITDDGPEVLTRLG